MRRLSVTILPALVMLGCATNDLGARITCPLFEDARYTVTVHTAAFHCDDDLVLNDGDLFDPLDDACEPGGVQRLCDVELMRSCAGNITQDIQLSFNEDGATWDGTIVLTKPGDSQTCTETYDVSLTPLD